MSHGEKRPSRRPQNTKKTLLGIFARLKPHRLRLFLVLIGIIISSGANIAGNYALRPIINNFIEPLKGQTNPDLSGFARTLALLSLVYATGALASYLYARLMVTVSSSTLARIRSDLFSHLQALPLRFHDTNSNGELMSRFTNDTDALREMLSQGIPQLFSSVITIPAVFVIMLFLSPALTAIVVVILCLMLFTVSAVGKRSGTAFKAQQAALGRVNGYVEEMIEGQRVVKVFGREDTVRGDFSQINEELRAASTRANTYANILMPIMHNLSYVLFALVATAGSALVIGEKLDVGTLASFLLYTRSFSQPITQVSQQINHILSALAGAERIFDMLAEPIEGDEGTVRLVCAAIGDDGTIIEADGHTGHWAWKDEGQDPPTYTRLLGDVRFEHVSFSYTPEKTVLHDLSLYAKPGQKIAFVGSTGAGKTTITNLINRFYEIKGGEILYDGIPISKIKKGDLRRSLAMVLQDTHLFAQTVKDNIRYGNLAATDEQVEDAARLAGAHSFISRLPEGYDTIIQNDGSSLSQGQRQLLNIARAACADAPVLILDEATSSIDTRTEAIIERGMDKLMAGRTVFVIAHRLSTVRNADAIMVLEEGRIIERGDHDSLLAQKGRYYELYSGMFELS